MEPYSLMYYVGHTGIQAVRHTALADGATPYTALHLPAFANLALNVARNDGAGLAMHIFYAFTSRLVYKAL